MRFSKIMIAALLAVCASSSAYAQLKPMEPATDKAAAADPRLYKQLPSDVVLGNEKAPVTMIEYASLSCPHCAHFAKNILPDLEKKYVETGKVKYIYRDFPLDDPALKGSILVHCANKDSFYTFLKVLFDRQEAWAAQKNYVELLTNIGKLGGLSGDKIASCFADKKLETSIIETKLTAANTLEIKATPTFFINGDAMHGAGDESAFISKLDSAIAAAGNGK